LRLVTTLRGFLFQHREITTRQHCNNHLGSDLMYGCPNKVWILHLYEHFWLAAAFPCVFRQCVCIQSLFNPATTHPCHPQTHPSLTVIPSTFSQSVVGCPNSFGGIKVKPSTYFWSSLRCVVHVSLCTFLIWRITQPLGNPVSQETQIASWYSQSYRMYRFMACQLPKIEIPPPVLEKILMWGQGSVTADLVWRPIALFTRQNGNLCALFTRQKIFVVADRPPSPTLKITFDASKVALLAGRPRIYILNHGSTIHIYTLTFLHTEIPFTIINRHS
jgi:hypothetical protein